MKKYRWFGFLVFSGLILLSSSSVFFAEETAVPAAVDSATELATEPASVAAAPVEAAPTEPAVSEEPPMVSAETLEFVSGEVTAIDATAGTITLKLYGDLEDGSADKVVTITADANTDITDGENDRTLASVEAGTEVDVEYDPATNKSTYVFIY